jgi:hypothetical protein
MWGKKVRTGLSNAFREKKPSQKLVSFHTPMQADYSIAVQQSSQMEHTC